MSDTTERILDVAEQMFADAGIDAVSVRSVIEAAGVNVAAVHYHFGGREELICAVLRRRVVPLNAVRLERLERVVLAAGSVPPALEDVLRAFIAPVFELLEQTPQAAWLLAQVYVSPSDSVRTYFYELFVELVQRFGAVLAWSLAGVLPDDVAWCRVQFTWGAMLHTLSKHRRHASMSQHGFLPTELCGAQLVEEWVQFCAAGLRAPTSNLTVAPPGDFPGEQ